MIPLIAGTITDASAELRMIETGASPAEYVGFKAPAAVSTNFLWTMPAADGGVNQCLATNGSGTLIWKSTQGTGYSLDASDGSPVNALYVDATGSVGIATTSPARYLHVVAPAGATTSVARFETQAAAINAVLEMQDSTAAQDRGASFNFLNAAGSAMGQITYGSVNHATKPDALTFNTNGAEKMRIDTNGRVGIGTTGPSAKLEVGTSAGVVPLYINNNADTANSTPLLVLRQGQGGSPYSRQPAIAFAGPWSVSNPTEYFGTIRALNDNGGPGAAASSSLRFATASGDPAVVADKMTITGSGDVGIGTTAPTVKLEVSGSVKATNFVGILNGVKMGSGFFGFTSGNCATFGAACSIDLTAIGFSSAPYCALTMRVPDNSGYTEKMVIQSITTTTLKVWKGTFPDTGTTMSGYWVCIGP